MAAAKCEAAVLEYLTKQNRPYSVNDVVLNLHKEHGKSAVQKALDVLVADARVKEKINGKQKAYVVCQENLPSASEAELSGLENDLKIKKSALDELVKVAKAAEAEVKQYSSRPMTSAILSEIEALKGDAERLRERRDQLSSEASDAKPLDTKAIEAMAKKKESAIKEWRKRKRSCVDVVNSILENYPKSKKILLEDIGVETDEDAGVSLPQTKA